MPPSPTPPRAVLSGDFGGAHVGAGRTPPSGSTASGAVNAFTLELAEVLHRNPGMARTLMRAHVDDGSGYCAGCPSTVARSVWPCTIAWHVTRANELTR